MNLFYLKEIYTLKSSIKGSFKKYNRTLWDIASYSDGNFFLEEICSKLKISKSVAKNTLKILKKNKIITY